MSQIKLIPTPSWLVYFVIKAQPFFLAFVKYQEIYFKYWGGTNALAYSDGEALTKKIFLSHLDGSRPQVRAQPHPGCSSDLAPML